jgi:NitT/TauT family transport system substrate-binding protein
VTRAFEDGELAAAGIDVAVGYFRNGSEVADLLDRGELDAGLGGHLQTLAASLAGSDQCFFAGVGFEQAPDHLPVAMVVATHDAAKGFANGATIAMSARAAISDLQLRIFANAEGIDYLSLSIVTMPFSEMQEALLKGRIDAASVPDPFASQIERSGIGRIVDRGTLSRQMPTAGRVMITGLVSTKRWIEQHAVLASGFADVVKGVITVAPARTDGRETDGSKVEEPIFDARLRPEDLQLAFDLAADYGVVSGHVAAESVIAIPESGHLRTSSR